MKREDPPAVIGFKRLSWLIGILGMVICFTSTVSYYYMGEVLIGTFFAGGAAFGFARVLVLVIRGFRVGNDKEPKVITGFKRFSWLGTFFFTACIGIFVGFYDEPSSGIIAAFVTGIIVFPILRFLVLWIVRGFAAGKNVQKIGF